MDTGVGGGGGGCCGRRMCAACCAYSPPVCECTFQSPLGTSAHDLGICDEPCTCSDSPPDTVTCSSSEDPVSEVFSSLKEAADHMQNALNFLSTACCEHPVCIADRPRVYPCTLPRALPCHGLTFPGGFDAYPSRARTSLAPLLAPCPTCTLKVYEEHGGLPVKGDIWAEARSCHGDCEEKLGQRLLGAAQCGRTQRVRKLLKMGADPNFRGCGRWTALHKASASGMADVVLVLLRCGALADARNCNGYTPLHLAARHDDSGLCVSLLVCAGADLEARNEPGDTPLHVAAATCNKAAVSALVAAGASRFVKNNAGRTPFELAKCPCMRRLLVCRCMHPLALF